MGEQQGWAKSKSTNLPSLSPSTSQPRSSQTGGDPAFRVLPRGHLLEKPPDVGLGVGVRPALAIAVQSLSRVRLCATPRTVAHQAPLSMGFPRQEYWSGLPFPPPGDLPNTETEPTPSLTSPALAGSLPLAPPGKPHQFALKLHESFQIPLRCHRP